MTKGPNEENRNSIEQELAGALAALKRARRRAEKTARDTGTMIILSKDGKPVRVPPPPAE